MGARADRWLFGWGSPAALAVFRILLGLCAFVSIGLLFLDANQWFTEGGYVPQAMREKWLPPVAMEFMLFGREFRLSGNVPRIGLLNQVTDPRLVTLFFAVVWASSVAVIFGWQTRIATIVMALGIVSLHHRNPIILQGADTTLRVSAIYLALAPCGLMYSLDARRRGSPAPPVSLWPQRLIAINCAVIYGMTMWVRLIPNVGNMWKEGIATWYSPRLAEFERFPVPAFVNELPFVRFSTYATSVIELSLALLVWFKPLRKWVLIGGLLLHAFIDYSMNIPLFSYVICSMYVCFYSGEEVEAWVDRMRARFRPSPSIPKQSELTPHEGGAR